MDWSLKGVCFVLILIGNVPSWLLELTDRPHFVVIMGGSCPSGCIMSALINSLSYICRVFLNQISINDMQVRIDINQHSKFWYQNNFQGDIMDSGQEGQRVTAYLCPDQPSLSLLMTERQSFFLGWKEKNAKSKPNLKFALVRISITCWT